MDIGLVLGLAKVALEIFQDERRDRFLKKYHRIINDHQEELNKGPDNYSDRRLDELLIEAQNLGQLIIAEAAKR